jgi:hypothetical protein
MEQQRATVRRDAHSSLQYPGFGSRSCGRLFPRTQSILRYQLGFHCLRQPRFSRDGRSIQDLQRRSREVSDRGTSPFTEQPSGRRDDRTLSIPGFSRKKCWPGQFGSAEIISASIPIAGAKGFRNSPGGRELPPPLGLLPARSALGLPRSRF